MKLKVGDRVKVINHFATINLKDYTGTVLKIKDNCYGSIGVKFDSPFPGGHDLDGNCPNGYGRWGSQTELIKLNKTIINVRKLNKSIYDFKKKEQKDERNNAVKESRRAFPASTPSHN